MEIYVLNKNLERIAIFDTYTSVIWANRYWNVGDCELYLPASSEALQTLQRGFYLMRSDDSMVCVIRKIELNTTAENGNYLIVHGYDVKTWLDQRVIWNITTADGNAEAFIDSIVSTAFSSAERQIKDTDGNRIFYVGSAAGFTEALSEQLEHENIGEKVREYCKRFGWGYRVDYLSGQFFFQLYNGTDRSASVIFSPTYDNLLTSQYVEDETHMGNVARVGGEGSRRIINSSGLATGADRFEFFVNAKDIARYITFAQLKEIYPLVADGGQGYISGNIYKVYQLDILLLDDAQKTELETIYPDGTVVTIDGNDYFRIGDVEIADLPANVTDDSTVSLRNIIYKVYLLSRGYEAMAEYGMKVTFGGTIEPRISYKYRTDYNLGDIVRVENEYGIAANARIVEIVEVDDNNGYRIEPKYEYIEEE